MSAKPWSAATTPERDALRADSHGWVLVVEDDPMVARSIGQVFRAHIADVVVVHGSHDALMAIERPGLVGALVDVWLGPDDDGIALAATIARRCADAEVIPWSGREDLAAARRARDLGLPYLMKGTEPSIERKYARKWAHTARATTWLQVERERRVMALCTAHSLTELQAECLRLALGGWSYATIAHFRGVSTTAIDDVSERLHAKTGRTLAELAHHIDAEILALRTGHPTSEKFDGPPTRKLRRKV